MGNAKNKKPYIIGLTGGVASGKSSALEYFKEKGFITIDCDKIVSSLWEEDFFKETVKKSFGLDVDDKKIKSVVSKIVFEDEQKRQMLNDLTHPLVLDKINTVVKENSQKDIIVVDMPLLFEIEYDKVDTTLLIYVNEQEQLKRLCLRNNINGIQAQKIINSQIPLSRKYFLADHVIDNNQNLYHLKKELDDYIKQVKDEIKRQS